MRSSATRRRAADADDVPHDGQADELRGDHARAQLGPMPTHPGGDRQQHALGEDVADEGGRLRLGDSRAKQGQERAAGRRLLDHRDQQPSRVRRHRRAAARRRLDDALRLDRQLDRGREQLLLRPEIVEQQPGVDAGFVRDPTQGRLPVPRSLNCRRASATIASRVPLSPGGRPRPRLRGLRFHRWENIISSDGELETGAEEEDKHR